jgi:hypothetical protein
MATVRISDMTAMLRSLKKAVKCFVIINFQKYATYNIFVYVDYEISWRQHRMCN